MRVLLLLAFSYCISFRARASSSTSCSDSSILFSTSDITRAGHGKGVWDGLAAVFKSWLRRYITDGELNLRTAHEVYEKLLDHFTSAAWVLGHAKV